MPSVILYRADGTRSRTVCDAMAAGIRAVGDAVSDRHERDYRGVEADVAVFYGLQGNCRRALAEYRAAGRTAVYIDLGYWGRRDGGRWQGFHKLCVNGLHPTGFQSRRHAGDRLARFGIAPAPWQPAGNHILLAGMSAKAATVNGFAPEEWERNAIAEIRRHTDRPIIYRPKPSWREAKPIAGVAWDNGHEPVEKALVGCHAVVTHHSNAAIDGLMAGVPAFSWDGVAVPMASQDLAGIEAPWRPDGRDQWLADIAYTQWNVAEMRDGAAWRHLKDEGMVP